jgi:hypothetical protein
MDVRVAVKADKSVIVVHFLVRDKGLIPPLKSKIENPASIYNYSKLVFHTSNVEVHSSNPRVTVRAITPVTLSVIQVRPNQQCYQQYPPVIF